MGKERLKCVLYENTSWKRSLKRPLNSPIYAALDSAIYVGVIINTKESPLYQLYYHSLNASMAPHFVLEALKADFELILVDRKSNAQKSDEYLALNPSGRVPTLIDGELVFLKALLFVFILRSQIHHQISFQVLALRIGQSFFSV
jgi:hypothetical protein